MTAADPRTVMIELARPFAPLPAYLTLGILPAHRLGGMDAAALIDAPFNRAPIGAGPYRLTQLRQDRAVLTANAAFHFEQSFIPRIELRFFANEGDTLGALRADLLDGAYVTLGLKPSDEVYVERRSSMRLTLLSAGDVTSTSRSGYPWAATSSPSPRRRRSPAAWTAVGVRAGLDVVGATELVRERIETGAFEALLFSQHAAADPDPFAAWHSAGGANLTSFNDARVDALTEEARGLAQPSRRRELYREFQTAFAEAVPAIPLYVTGAQYIQKTALRGARPGRVASPGDRFWQVQEWYLNTR